MPKLHPGLHAATVDMHNGQAGTLQIPLNEGSCGWAGAASRLRKGTEQRSTQQSGETFIGTALFALQWQGLASDWPSVLTSSSPLDMYTHRWESIEDVTGRCDHSGGTNSSIDTATTLSRVLA